MALLSLPSELLEQLWSCEELSHVDVCKLGQVCSLFHDISHSNEVWKAKFSQRFPDLLTEYSCSQDVDWKAEFEGRYTCGVVIMRKIGSMSEAHFHQEEPSEETYDKLKEMVDQSNKNSGFIIDALMDIVYDGKKNHNLTYKYYAEKTLRFMRHLQLKKDWEEFLALPHEEQLLEKGAVLLSQWCQPTVHVSETKVVWELDRIANMVRENLRLQQPDHPACKTQEEMPTYLNESQMSATHSRTALEALNRMLYKDLGFVGNEDDYYNPHNSYIDKVLEYKLGIPISLAIIYISVARRLGVRCDPVNFPNHFLIKFKEHPELPPEQAYTYIDVFNKGKFMSPRECNEMNMMRPVSPTAEIFNAVPPSKVMARMVLNLIHIGRQQGQMGDGLMALRNSVELGIILIPDSLESCTLLARLNMHLGINIKETIEMLERVSGRFPPGLENPLHILLMNARILQGEKETEEAEINVIVPKLRSRHWRVHYSVGLIMKHKKYNYTCVITGWDDRCEASQEWMLQMSVHNLENQGSQPFYNVLVEDGSNRYAAQENLYIAPEPYAIPHREVGKFFDEFCGTHYMPNHQKNQQYPEDLEKTLQFINSTYGG